MIFQVLALHCILFLSAKIEHALMAKKPTATSRRRKIRPQNIQTPLMEIDIKAPMDIVLDHIVGYNHLHYENDHHNLEDFSTWSINYKPTKLVAGGIESEKQNNTAISRSERNAIHKIICAKTLVPPEKLERKPTLVFLGLSINGVASVAVRDGLQQQPENEFYDVCMSWNVTVHPDNPDKWTQASFGFTVTVTNKESNNNSNNSNSNNNSTNAPVMIPNFGRTSSAPKRMKDTILKLAIDYKTDTLLLLKDALLHWVKDTSELVTRTTKRRTTAAASNDNLSKNPHQDIQTTKNAPSSNKTLTKPTENAFFKKNTRVPKNAVLTNSNASDETSAVPKKSRNESIPTKDESKPVKMKNNVSNDSKAETGDTLTNTTQKTNTTTQAVENSGASNQTHKSASVATNETVRAQKEQHSNTSPKGSSPKPKNDTMAKEEELPTNVVRNSPESGDDDKKNSPLDSKEIPIQVKETENNDSRTGPDGHDTKGNLHRNKIDAGTEENSNDFEESQVNDSEEQPQGISAGAVPNSPFSEASTSSEAYSVKAHPVAERDASSGEARMGTKLTDDFNPLEPNENIGLARRSVLIMAVCGLLLYNVRLCVTR